MERRAATQTIGTRILLSQNSLSHFDLWFLIFDFVASRFARCSDSLLKQWREHTLGSETSQYQEEKRTIVIPLVAASETGGAQTQPHK